MAILECMWQRGLIWLAIVLSVCVASVGFLPFGAGPYTAVYGPASALRAQRAILLLALAISFISTAFALLAALGCSESDFLDAAVLVRQLCSSSTPAHSLRC
jgi:hypothetical protein